MKKEKDTKYLAEAAHYILWNVPQKQDSIEKQKVYLFEFEEILMVLNVVYNHIDLEFDFDDMPVMNVCPPDFDLGEGVVWFCGMNPDGITNVEAKRRYLDAIKVNAQKAKKYSFQNRLLLLKASLTRSLYSIIASHLNKVGVDFGDLDHIVSIRVERKEFIPILIKELDEVKIRISKMRESMNK